MIKKIKDLTNHMNIIMNKVHKFSRLILFAEFYIWKREKIIENISFSINICLGLNFRCLRDNIKKNIIKQKSEIRRYIRISIKDYDEVNLDINILLELLDNSECEKVTAISIICVLIISNKINHKWKNYSVIFIRFVKSIYSLPLWFIAKRGELHLDCEEVK